MSRVEGKMSRVESKKSRVESEKSRVESKKSRVENKKPRIERKKSRVASFLSGFCSDFCLLMAMVEDEQFFCVLFIIILITIRSGLY